MSGNKLSIWLNEKSCVLGLVLTLCVVVWMLQVGAQNLAPTVDEPFHLIRGLAWWWAEDTRLSYAHPPLANILAALPNAFSEMDLTTLKGWDNAHHVRVASQFMQQDYQQFLNILTQGRQMMMLMFVMFLVYVWYWVGKQFGSGIALIAVIFIGCNPSLLAHARLVTTDIAIVIFVFVSITQFIDYLERGSSIAGFAIFYALAIGTKFTALALAPLFLVVGIFYLISAEGRYSDKPGQLLFFDVLVVGIVCLLTLAALYRFQDVGLTVGEIMNRPEPINYLTKDHLGFFLDDFALIRNLPNWLPIPVPYTWYYGLESVTLQNSAGHDSWFMGARTNSGNIWYFPTLLLLKTPLIIILALVSRLISLRCSRQEGVMLLFVVFLSWFLLTSELNIGIRHALLVVPLISIVAALGLKQIASKYGRIILLLVLMVPARASFGAG